MTKKRYIYKAKNAEHSIVAGIKLPVISDKKVRKLESLKHFGIFLAEEKSLTDEQAEALLEELTKGK